MKTPETQLTEYWPQLSLSCTAGYLPRWHQSFSRQTLHFLLSVEKQSSKMHNDYYRAKPDCWGAWPPSQFALKLRHGWTDVKVQFLRCYYAILKKKKKAVPDALRSLGVLKTLWEEGMCLTSSTLQTLTALLGTICCQISSRMPCWEHPKSSWAARLWAWEREGTTWDTLLSQAAHSVLRL